MVSAYLLKFKLNYVLISLCAYTLVLAGDLSIHACKHCLHSHRSCLPLCFSRRMAKWNPILCIICLFSSSSTCSWSGKCFYQVIEIIDRYETDCIPTPSRSDKVGYIQGPGDKKCNRTLKVRFSFPLPASFIIIIKGL